MYGYNVNKRRINSANNLQKEQNMNINSTAQFLRHPPTNISVNE